MSSLRRFITDQKSPTHSCMKGSVRGIFVSDRTRASFYEHIAIHHWNNNYISELFAEQFPLLIDFDFRFSSSEPTSFANGPALFLLTQLTARAVHNAFQIDETNDQLIVTACTPTPVEIEGSYKAGIHIFFPKLIVNAQTYRQFLRSLQIFLRDNASLQFEDAQIITTKLEDIIDLGVKAIRIYPAKKFARKCKNKLPGHLNCNGKCQVTEGERTQQYRQYSFVAAYTLTGGDIFEDSQYDPTFELANSEFKTGITPTDDVIDARVDILSLLSMRPTQRGLALIPFRDTFQVPEIEEPSVEGHESKSKKKGRPIKLDSEIGKVIQKLVADIANVKLTSIVQVKGVYSVDLKRNICFNHPLKRDGSCHEHSSNRSYVIISRQGYITFHSHDEDCKHFHFPIEIQNRKTIELLFGQPPKPVKKRIDYTNDTSQITSTLLSGMHRVRSYLYDIQNVEKDIDEILKFF